MTVTSEYFDRLVDRRGTASYKWDQPMGDDVIPMWVADMDFMTAPAVIEAMRKRVEHGIFGYVAVPEDYYQATIDWFGRRHGWLVDRSWIQYLTGVVPALSVIVKAFTLPGDRVLVMTPVYNCFFSSIRNNGCRVEESPLRYADGTYTIDYADLELRAALPETRLLLLCNPHNPAGRVWTRDELARVGEICRRHDVVVVSDEIHCEFVAPGHRYTPFASLPGHEAFSVTCVSPSKAFNIAGLKIANIICADPRWRERIDRAININEVCDANPFAVDALIAAYTAGGPWIDALCDYIHGNYCLLRDAFAARLPQLTVTRLEGTYLAWVDCRRLGMSSDDLVAALLERARVLLNSGVMYGEAGEGFVRVNLACPRSRVAEAVDRMLPVLEAL